MTSPANITEALRQKASRQLWNKGLFVFLIIFPLYGSMRKNHSYYYASYRERRIVKKGYLRLTRHYNLRIKSVGILNTKNLVSH